MAYNKASEERKWRLWKEAEEKQLRELGVSEDRIAQLRTYDWEVFNLTGGITNIMRMAAIISNSLRQMRRNRM